MEYCFGFARKPYSHMVARLHERSPDGHGSIAGGVGWGKGEEGGGGGEGGEDSMTI